MPPPAPPAPGSASTVTGRKSGAVSAPSRPARYARRHVVNSAREIPCWRAVAATRRGSAKLSATMRSFAAVDQRRRRPTSTISMRDT
ncbi:MAG TPA: hypothetical protein VFY87_29095 [Geminicoccaceae bacterium]|nr:hypothetical protein [Geminicoccaceae bacterium]